MTNIFKCIFFDEKAWIAIKISLKFFLEGSTNNMTTLVQIMACRLFGDKPLSEPMIIHLPAHMHVSQSDPFVSPLQKNSVESVSDKSYFLGVN